MGKAVTVIIDEKELFKNSLQGNFKEAIDEITGHIDELMITRTGLFQRAWPDFDWMVHRVTMMWDCEKSPIGYCVYNQIEDRSFDDCIFCHEPHERK